MSLHRNPDFSRRYAGILEAEPMRSASAERVLEFVDALDNVSDVSQLSEEDQTVIAQYNRQQPK